MKKELPDGMVETNLLFVQAIASFGQDQHLAHVQEKLLSSFKYLVESFPDKNVRTSCTRQTGRSASPRFLNIGAK
jgi:hypothetical protein